MPLTSLREQRLLRPLRATAKRALVRWDVVKHRRDPEVRDWLDVCAGAPGGHVVVPSRAIASSRAEAADFVARGLVGPGSVVLDVGAGNGRQAIGLLEHGIARYVGLDVVRESVDYGNRAFRGRGEVSFDWLDVANDMYNPAGSMRPEQVVFPYADETFDCAVAGSLYTHLERLPVAARYAQETARVLRSGGGAFLSFFRSPPNALSSSAVRTVFPQDAVLDLLAQAGLTVEATAGGNSADWHDQWRIYARKA